MELKYGPAKQTRSTQPSRVLSELGLTNYETRAYLTLLKEGPQTCKMLTRITGIPTGKIYSVMNSLLAEGWVTTPARQRPKTYYATNPETAIKKRLIDFKEELNNLESSASNISPLLKSEFDQHYRLKNMPVCE